MSVEVPTSEPAEIRAGDTITWLKSDADYPPADGWTLKYSLRNQTSKINITATTSGTDYLVSETAATTAAWTPGAYSWICYVTKGSGATLEQHTRDDGAVTVLPNLSADVIYDTRTDARKIYDDLLTAYKSFVASGGRIRTHSIAGRSVSYDSREEILKELEHWAAEVRAEEDASAVAKGFASRRKVGARFTRI